MDAKDGTSKQREPLDPGTADQGTAGLLWQLSTLRSLAHSEASGPPIDDDEIERYRRGEMPPEESSHFEQRLAADERGLERLARVVTRPAARRQPTLRLAASILVGALATAGLFYGLKSASVETVAFEMPRYSVAVEGLADRRGEEPGASYETRIGSTVRIVARPATTPAQDLAFALYRRGGSGSLTRVPAAAARIQVERGTAVLEAEASALVGRAPGLHELALLIGPEDFTAPSTATRSALDDLAQQHGLQVLGFELRLLR